MFSPDVHKISRKQARIELQTRRCNKPQSRNRVLRYQIMMLQEDYDNRNLGGIELKVSDMLHEEHKKNPDFFGDYTFYGVQKAKNAVSNKYFTFYRAGGRHKNIYISVWKFFDKFVREGGISLKRFIADIEKQKNKTAPLLPPVTTTTDSTVAESDSEM